MLQLIFASVNNLINVMLEFQFFKVSQGTYVTFLLEEMLDWDVPFTLGNYRDKITWDSAEAKKRNFCECRAENG